MDDNGIKRGLRTGFSPIKYLFNIFFGIIGLLLVTFIILIPVSMIWVENPLVSYFYNKVTDPLINTGFGNFVKKGISTLSIPFSEKKQVELLESYSWKTSIDENSKKQDLGVKITSFKASNDKLETRRFNVVEAIAEGYASSTDPTEIKFLCLTEDDEKEGEVANKNNILQISGNRKEYFALKCIYSKDLFEIDANDATDSKKIKIRASYEFLTEGYVPIYFVQESVLNQLTEENSKSNYNIFKSNDIQDENLNEEEGTVSSVYTKGPIKLILRSISTQPYTEEGPFGPGSDYTLDIKIDDVQEWTGNLEEIKDLLIYIPDEISINSENFEYSREENNFNIYSAKSSLINSLNNICKSKKDSLIEEDCWRSGVITTSMEFSINNAPEELSKTFIRTKLNYIFNDEKQDTITFLSTV